MALLIEWPYLALPPALFFAALYYRRRRRAMLAAALAWLAYFPYEQAMKMRILCTGECNIRVDLLLIYPILVLVSVVALFSLRTRKNDKVDNAL